MLEDCGIGIWFDRNRSEMRIYMPFSIFMTSDGNDNVQGLKEDW